MADVSLQYTTDQKDVRKAFEQLVRENTKLRETVSKLAKESKAASQAERLQMKVRLDAIRQLQAEQQKQGSHAKAIADSQLSPLQKLSAATAELRGHVAAGRLTDAQAKMERDRLLQAYKASKIDTDAAREAQKRENDEMQRAATITRLVETATEKHGRAIRELNKLRAAGKISAQTHQRATDMEKASLQKATPAAEGFGASMLRTGAAVLGANSAMAAGQKIVALLRQEYDRLIERQEAALGANVTLAEAQEQAAFNLGNDPTMSMPQLFGRLRKESNNLGMNEKDLTKAASQALSARGDRSAEDAIDAVVAAANLRRFSPEELPGIAASALDLSKGTGMTLEESLGFLLETGTLSRVVDLKSLSDHVAPTIIGSLAMGTNKEFGGAVTAAITQGMVDSTGRKGRTTTTALLAQLRDYGEHDGLKGASVREKFEAIVASGPEGMRQFMAASTFERLATPTIEKLLTRGSDVHNQFLNGLDTLEELDEQGRFDQTRAGIEALPAVQIAKADQVGKNLGEQLALADTGGATSAAVRSAIDNVRTTLGDSALSVKTRSILTDVAQGGQRSLPELVSALQTTRNDIGLQAVGRGEKNADGNFLLNATESGQVQALTAAINSLTTLMQQQAAGQNGLADVAEKLAAPQVGNRRQAQAEGAP